MRATNLSSWERECFGRSKTCGSIF
jgi:hypothetical protein